MALPDAGAPSGGYAVPPCSRLDAYVARLRELLRAPLDRRERLDRLAAAVAGVARDGLEVPAAARRLEPGCAYGRNLLYRDPELGFVLIAMSWPEHAEAPPHDHGTWCGVAVLEGRVRITEYRRPSPGATRVEALRTVDAARGDSCLVRPPLDDVHRVWNPFPEPALTLHTYGRDIPLCRVFDPERGTAEEHRLGYANVPG